MTPKPSCFEAEETSVISLALQINFSDYIRKIAQLFPY